jgi:cobalamin-dependent methionine synthase I
MALAPAGRLPLYGDLEQETRQLCEDVILNSQKDQTALKRFMAFLNFRHLLSHGQSAEG